jgi:hypothetical protein
LSLNKREHDIWYPILVNNFNEVCSMCGRSPKSKVPEHFVLRLLIHEKEYKRPLKLENLSLACDSCNQLIHPEKQEKFKREMSPELAINRVKEPRAREYMVNRILLDGSCNIRKLLSSCAEKVGCSIKTADSYLDKLTSDEGRLVEVLGDIYLNGYQPIMKFDIMANIWVTEKEAKPIPPEIVKEIQRQLLVR